MNAAPTKLIVSLFILASLASLADAAPRTRTGNPVVDFFYGDRGVYVMNVHHDALRIKVSKMARDLEGRWVEMPEVTIGTIGRQDFKRILPAGFNVGQIMNVKVELLGPGGEVLDTQARRYTIPRWRAKPWTPEWAPRLREPRTRR